VFFTFISSVYADDELRASQKAPEFVLKILDSSKVLRSKKIFSEKRITVLIFWDSYCRDCLSAVANCQKLYKNLDNPDVGFVSVNFDSQKLPEARRFIKGEGITFPVLSDPSGAVVSKYKAKGYDFSFFILDKENIIRYVCYDHPPDVADVIKTQVDKLLRERLKPSDAAPDFALKSIIDGNVIHAEESFSEKKRTVLVFWNSQSKECLDALAEIQKIQDKLNISDIGFLSVNFDKDITKPKAFLEKKDLKFPVLHDSNGEISVLYKADDYCFSFFIIDNTSHIMYIFYDPPRNIAEIIETQTKE